MQDRPGFLRFGQALQETVKLFFGGGTIQMPLQIGHLQLQRQRLTYNLQQLFRQNGKQNIFNIF